MLAEPRATDKLALVVCHASSRSAGIVEAAQIECSIERSQVANAPAVADSNVISSGSDPHGSLGSNFIPKKTVGVIDRDRPILDAQNCLQLLASKLHWTHLSWAVRYEAPDMALEGRTSTSAARRVTFLTLMLFEHNQHAAPNNREIEDETRAGRR